MVGNLYESNREEAMQKKMKELEYKYAKSRIKSAYGKKALSELNKYWDYTSGMFDHLK